MNRCEVCDRAPPRLIYIFGTVCSTCGYHRASDHTDAEILGKFKCYGCGVILYEGEEVELDDDGRILSCVYCSN